MHGDPVRLEDANQLIGDLNAYALLDGEAPREQAHQPGELGDADDVLVRDVADKRVAVEGQRVVLAEREELDGPLDDLADVAVRPAVALGRKGCQELGIAFVTGRGLEQRTQEAAWSGSGSGRVQVHPEGFEDLGRVTLELLPLFGAYLPRPHLFPMRGLLGIEGEARHFLTPCSVHVRTNVRG